MSKMESVQSRSKQLDCEVEFVDKVDCFFFIFLGGKSWLCVFNIENSQDPDGFVLDTVESC